MDDQDCTVSQTVSRRTDVECQGFCIPPSHRVLTNPIFQVQELVRASFEFIAKKATEEGIRESWEPKMVAVYDNDRGLIWVKREYEKEYSTAASVLGA